MRKTHRPHDHFTHNHQAKENFGLIKRTYETDGDFDPNSKKTQWERFAYYVDHLRQTSAGKTDYKILYLGRHGEGFHNVAEAFFGTAAWDVRFSLPMPKR